MLTKKFQDGNLEDCKGDRKMVIKINPFTWHIYEKHSVQYTIIMRHTNTQAYSYWSTPVHRHTAISLIKGWRGNFITAKPEVCVHRK